LAVGWSVLVALLPSRSVPFVFFPIRTDATGALEQRTDANVQSLAALGWTVMAVPGLSLA
jgi:hypothetical protein